MKKIVPIIIGLIFIIVIIKVLSNKGNLNSIPNEYFTPSGELIKQPVTAKIDSHAIVKFYVESSGSMNGFFRNNVPTKFKHDVYEIMSYYSNVTKSINIMTNQGDIATQMTLPQFRNAMNTASLQSNASTQVPIMLSTIISQLKKDEVAVLISDMKYSPVGASAPAVLLSEYGSDITRITKNSKKCLCLICAVSNYADKTGNNISNQSPYYYLIIGDQDKVSFIRNGISSLLEENKNFIDNIEAGYKYASVPYSFGIPQNAVQYESQPTFYDYDEALGDCVISLKLHLEAYRWIMANKDTIKKYFICKSLYGSKVSIKDITVMTNNYSNQKLKRSSIATIKLHISNMPYDMDIIKWNLTIPSGEQTTLIRQFYGAKDENDLTKSYSIESFIQGISQEGMINTQPEPNYILITKQN